MTKVWVVCRWNRVFQRRMVCQRYMEAGHTRLLQQRNEHRQFFFHHTGIAKVRIFLPDGQLVINGHPPELPHGLPKLLPPQNGRGFLRCRRIRRYDGLKMAELKLPHIRVAMHLHHIKASLFCQCCCFAESADDLMDLPLRHIGNVRGHFCIQFFPAADPG